MKHDTISQRFGNILFFGFAGISGIATVMSVAMLSLAAWSYGNYLIKNYSLKSSYFSHEEIISGSEPRQIQNNEKSLPDIITYEEAFADQILYGLQEDAKSKSIFGLGFAATSFLSYLVGRALRYIFSGV